MSFSKDDFADKTGVSRAVLDDYQIWGDLLEKWNPRINLVAPSTLSDYWHRHAYDSWQIISHISDRVETVIDLGSGAGFPGLAVAIEMKSRGRGHVTLVESAGKKVNFLRAVIRALNLPAKVLNERAESLELNSFDLITARAFAPMPRLLSYAHPFWGETTQGLFLKGKGLAHELRDAQKDWAFSHETHVSLTDEFGYIVGISKLERLKSVIDGKGTS